MNALRDRELVSELADRPELLAIADAVAETQRSRRHVPKGVLPLAAALTSAVVVVLAAPWGGSGPSVVEDALAAIGNRPVLHAVVEYSGDDAIVDLATGRSRPRLHRIEYWFDESRHQFRSRLSTDGVRTSEQVVTARRSCSDLGCVANDGLTAHLDPALAGFTTRYRKALQSGDASVTGKARIEGHDVELLTFSDSTGATTTVAVDAATHRPVRFSSTYPGGRRSPPFTVVAIESTSRDDDTFAPPRLSPPRPTTGEVSAGEEITLSRAEQALGRVPLWLGRDGLERIELQRTRTQISDGRRIAGVVVRLRYRTMQVGLATTAAGGYALGVGDGVDPEPPRGAVAIGRDWGGPRRWYGELRVRSFWVTLVAETRDELLAAARALRPAR
jgi:hypothetical protein